ncbi:MAG TPA: GNAT family N-acetyltransferase [Vibrio sp.]|nr:GNAT family N-acetyltransferase [Vibrio sp.]
METTQPHFLLNAFQPQDYAQLIAWITTEDLSYLWGGPCYRFPLDHQQIKAHCDQDEVFAYLFTVDNRNAGFVELYRESAHCFRLCRVFIADDYRGQKLAEVMLKMVIEKASLEFNARLITLAVFAHNQAAKRCYQTLGFRTTAIEKGTRTFKEQSWDLELMAKAL